jgi:hypothetical protein
MTLDLADYEKKALNAVKTFWGNREIAKNKQNISGNIDQGERAGVTAGKNMDGFLDLILDIIKVNGLQNAQIHHRKAALTLPGYFRPTKLWDLLVTYKGDLIVAIELKSQVGPSFGNNFNNRAEEAIGTAHDFWTAYRDGAFGEQSRPFVGWLMLVEDAVNSRSGIKDTSTHFPIFEEFKGASYLKRYDILCQKLMKEQLYTNASLIASRRTDAKTGIFSEMSPMTSLKTFIASLAGHIAGEAARFS